MKDLKQQLLIKQIDEKLKNYSALSDVTIPDTGWIQAIRITLKMSLRQFANRLGKSRSATNNIELREQEERITLKNLKEAGRALNMKLVYGFVPLDGSIEKMIEKRALIRAKEIVQTTSNTMALEDQKNSSNRLKNAVKGRAEQLIAEMPRHLWD